MVENIKELTTDQRRALSRDTNISVTAGAGTGKTLLLVERYIDILLKDNVDVKEILAITFTRKAAAEMKDRVAKRIEELLGTQVDEKVKNRLSYVRDRLSSANISTIHSFCARILKEYPVESGLDPDFGQLNDMQQKLLIEEEIQNELEDLDNNPDQWLDLFRYFSRDRIIEMLHLALDHRYEIEPVARQYDTLNIGQLYENLINLFSIYIEESINPADIESICRSVNEIISRDSDLMKSNDKSAQTLERLLELNKFCGQKNLDFWQTLFQVADFFTTTNNDAYTSPSAFGSVKILGKNLGTALVHLSQMFVPVIQKRITVPAQTDRYILSLLKQFYLLYHRFLERYNNRKQILGLVDYDDLQILLFKLMQENSQVKNRLSQQLKYIMVDEFQDTNSLQWQIISQLGDLAENKFFIVGDPKQSIYGFRNADIRVFENVKKLFKHVAEPVDGISDLILGESFRFAPRLADFINQTFNEILRSEPENPWEVRYDKFLSRRETETAGTIDLAIFGEDDQAEFIAAKARQLHEEYNFGDMAVLLRTRTHLSEVEDALRRSGIPFRTIGGIGFFQRQEIFDIYHLVRFLINPHDDNALVAILRSPINRISDEALFFLSEMRGALSYWDCIRNLKSPVKIKDQDYANLVRFKTVAGKWLKRREHMHFHELLNAIIRESYYRETLSAQLQGERYLSNLDKILEMAIDFERTGFISLSDFAQSLHNLIYKQDKESEAQSDLEDETTLKIMTIHQAKGLEFKVVFLPYLEMELRGGSTNSSIFIQEHGIAAPLKTRLPEQNPENNSYFLLEFLRLQKRKKELAELKRLFYVGCTRATDDLILSMRIKNNHLSPDTAAAWLLDTYKIDPATISDGTQIENINISKTIPVHDPVQSETWYRPEKNLARLKKLAGENIQDKSLPYFLNIPQDYPKGEIFSATQLMVFAADEQKYLERYHYGYFAEDYDIPASLAMPEDRSLLMGKIAHRFFEEYPQFDLEQILFDLEITDQQLRRDIYLQIDSLNMRAEKSKYLRSIMNARESRNEITVMMAMGDDYLSGTIDRMYKNESGIWEIVDYKTNRISKDQVARSAQKYEIQIGVYALLLSGIFPDQEEYPISLYFTHPDEIHRKIYNKTELCHIEEEMLEKIKQLKKFDPYRAGEIV